MTSPEKVEKPKIVVKIYKAFKSAEQWVNSMTKSAEDEPIQSEGLTCEDTVEDELDDDEDDSENRTHAFSKKRAAPSLSGKKKQKWFGFFNL